LIREGINGGVFPAGDVNALRGAIASVIEEPDRAKQMGRASREIICKRNFEADRIGLLNALGRVVSIEKHCTSGCA
jgi:glycosyltransferase involved in cell wall biosynthesis